MTNVRQYQLERRQIPLEAANLIYVTFVNL